jgi:hypothetical protein
MARWNLETCVPFLSDLTKPIWSSRDWTLMGRATASCKVRFN